MNKILKACIALAAFAALAVLPATASAVNTTTVVDANHVTLAPTHASPIPIVGTDNHGTFTRLTGAGGNTLISCTTNEITGNLETNTHTAVEGTITTATFKGKTGVGPVHTTHCTGETGDSLVNPNPATNGLPWCLQIKSIEPTEQFTVRGNSCTNAARPIRFTVQITTFLGTVHCEYQAASVTGKYTNITTPELKVEKAKFTEVTATICPDEAFLDMRMQVHRETSPGVLDEIGLTKVT
jgi:hypothetical protein